jgi:hypothetical protein
MAISPREIMKGSVLLHEGKVKVVKTIGDYIMFEGGKEFIGGSMINGEPLSDKWLEIFGFEYDHTSFCWIWRDPMVQSRHIIVYVPDGKDMHYVKYSLSGEECLLHAIQYVHQLQVLFFGIIGSHLPIPRNK